MALFSLSNCLYEGSLRSFALILCAIKSSVPGETGGHVGLCARYLRIGACTSNKKFKVEANDCHCFSQQSLTFTTVFQLTDAESAKNASLSKPFQARPVHCGYQCGAPQAARDSGVKLNECGILQLCEFSSK